jgi:hypothetical protein
VLRPSTRVHLRILDRDMQEPDIKRSRTSVLYASIVIVAVGMIGFVAAYYMQENLNAPQEVVGDPSKRIGKGDGKSENPIVINKLDTTTAPSEK